MKSKIKRLLMINIVIIASFVNMQPSVLAATVPKTMLIILDEFNLDLAEKLGGHNISIGLINNRTTSIYKSDGKVSQVMTLALGRRVKTDDRLFKGIEGLENGSIRIIGFDYILSSVKKNSDANIKDEFLIGEYLKSNDIEVGYIGNGSTALLATDRNGIIEHGINEVRYEKDWLFQKTKELLNRTDVVILEYEPSHNTAREELLIEYIEELKGVEILIISFDLLSPIAYKSYQGSNGTLTSNTTKRIGLVSNLDILPHIAYLYGLGSSYYIGNRIKRFSSENPYGILLDNLLQSINLNRIKYILHGLIIIADLYIIFFWRIRYASKFFNHEKIMNYVLIVIFVSFLLGFNQAYHDITLYLFILLTISIILVQKLSDKIILNGIPLAYIISIGIYLIILYGVFLNHKVLYKSVLGYNNILVGGRFYGLNNGIQGIFLASSVVVFYILKRLLGCVSWKKWMPLVVLIINTVALSGSFGANIGGYFTSIALIILIIYDNYLVKGSKKTKLLPIILLVTFVLIIINFYFDSISSNSHAGELIVRLMDFGFVELINIIKLKIRQIIFMTIFSPWVIILIGIIYFIKSNYDWIIKVEELRMIFYISVIGLLINDTGVIAFTYMNTFVIAISSSLHNTEKRDLC